MRLKKIITVKESTKFKFKTKLTEINGINFFKNTVKKKKKLLLIIK